MCAYTEKYALSTKNDQHGENAFPLWTSSSPPLSRQHPLPLFPQSYWAPAWPGASWRATLISERCMLPLALTGLLLLTVTSPTTANPDGVRTNATSKAAGMTGNAATSTVAPGVTESTVCTGLTKCSRTTNRWVSQAAPRQREWTRSCLRQGARCNRKPKLKGRNN